MTFLVPLGLLALLALPIILWLHLLRERRKRVVVPSLLHWQNLPRPREGQKRRRLPLTLLLLLHLLAAALLGVALAQPQWLGGLLGGGRHIALIIDTSTSMGAGDSAIIPGQGNSTRLDQARAHARSVINGLGGRDSIALIAAGSQAHLLATGDVDNRASLLAALDALQAGGTGTDIAGALTLAQAALEGYRAGRVEIVTDGALPALSATSENGLPETISVFNSNANVEWTIVGDERDNRALVALAARPRGGSDAQGRTAADVYARVANYGSSAFATDVRLFGDDQLIDTRQINLPAEGESELTWEVPPGVRVLRAEFDGRDTLPIDDQASLSLTQTRPIATLLVSADPGPLERALNAIPGTSIVVIDPGEYASSSLAARADLTIFDGMLPSRWPTGGVLVINPPEGNSPLLTVGNALSLVALERVQSQQLAPLPTGTSGSLFDGLNVDSVSFDLVHRVEVPSWATVQLAAGDVPLILRGRVNQSEVAIWTFVLGESNLPERLAFPLLMARTVRDLTPMPLPMALLAGEALTLRPGQRAETVEVLHPDGQVQHLVISPTLQFEGFTQPGMYTVTERAGSDIIYEGRVAVNAGAPLESDVRARPVPTDPGSNPGSSVAAAEQLPASRERQPLWAWFALAALAVMVIEWVYVHR